VAHYTTIKHRVQVTAQPLAAAAALDTLTKKLQ
jgi:hypothetical protein